ncbi:unnamed protein product, partial [Choristocarpus tenellus]
LVWCWALGTTKTKHMKNKWEVLARKSRAFKKAKQERDQQIKLQDKMRHLWALNKAGTSRAIMALDMHMKVRFDRNRGI